MVLSMRQLNLLKSTYQLLGRVGKGLPDALKMDLDEALAGMRKKNYYVAMELYKKVIPDYPHDPAVRNNVGCCLANLEKFDEAEIEFVKALLLLKGNRSGGLFGPRSSLRKTQHNLIKLYKTVVFEKNADPSSSLPGKDGCHHHRIPFKKDFQIIVKGIKQKGVINAFAKIPVYFAAKFNPVLRWYEKVLALRDQEFDRKNDITTAGLVYQADLRVDNKNQDHAVYYQGSDPLFFNDALLSLKIDFKHYTFIDFGSGKGKALFLASAYPFKKIIGIEFSEALNAIALENIRRSGKCGVEAYCMDAVDFKIPGEPLVCYFFDPFDAYIMEKVIDNIRESYTVYKRNIVIAYYNPRFQGLFDEEAWLERMDYIGPIRMWILKNNPEV
jgi:SAM-dependent methyltransferase